MIDNPTASIAPAALIVTVAMFSMALMQSDVEHRSRAVVDELTGMLNRAALAGRVEELAQQSTVTGLSVGMIVADIDHFKMINDTHGHKTGDAVLQDVAYLMRKQLRAFDLAYRLGGEEFLVLLPGADREQAAARRGAAARGHRARAAGRRHRRHDQLRRLSLAGAARASSTRASSRKPTRALYEAKRSGRNRVCEAGAEAHARRRQRRRDRSVSARPPRRRRAAPDARFRR